ncbi:hypothetical protein FQN57_003119 [Myotisia sp. PD_48]|nr:hypothetical protein FQN57_003119 [Myotisia sp. PD_48]
MASSPSSSDLNDQTKDGQLCSSRSRATFCSLPPELHIYLFQFLDFADLSYLRATSTYFYDLPSDAEIEKKRAIVVEDFLEWERIENRQFEDLDAAHFNTHWEWDHHTRRVIFSCTTFRCYTCLRSLENCKFTNDQTNGKRNKGKAEARERFCISCGEWNERWEPGQKLVNSNQKEHVFCRICRWYRPMSEAEFTSWLGICDACREYEDIPETWPESWAMSEQVPEWFAADKPLEIAKGPEEILDEIFTLQDEFYNPGGEEGEGAGEGDEGEEGEGDKGEGEEGEQVLGPSEMDIELEARVIGCCAA